MWLIAGLGNPGPKYELTRHNFGFLVVDALNDECGVSNTKSGFSGQVARMDLQGEACVSLKPETFMNRSGTSIQQAMSFHKIDRDKIIVIHDELDIPLGEVRIKKGGGNGGHNGLKDISRLIGPDFIRVRMGIGRPHIKGTESDFVLKPFHDNELPEVEASIKKAIRGVKILLENGLEKAMQETNARVQKNS